MNSQLSTLNSQLKMRIPFTKMAGAGNDFIIVDARRRRFPALTRRWPDVARAWCDRHAGIGADGLLLLEPSRSAGARMRVFNPDGSEAEMCGNGARCVARYLRDGAGGQVTIETTAGIIAARVRGNRVAIRLADPTELQLKLTLRVGKRHLTLAFVNTGVPHAVVTVPAVDDVDVAGLGRTVRMHEAFAPRGTNVNFVEQEAAGRVRLRTYERGVEAETLACGTGAVAAAVIYGLTRTSPAPNGRPAPRRVDVQVRSGEILAVSFRAARNPQGVQVADVVLEGPATIVYQGTCPWPAKGHQ